MHQAVDDHNSGISEKLSFLVNDSAVSLISAALTNPDHSALSHAWVSSQSGQESAKEAKSLKAIVEKLPALFANTATTHLDEWFDQSHKAESDGIDATAAKAFFGRNTMSHGGLGSANK